MFEMCRICLREIRDNAEYDCVNDKVLDLDAKLLDFVHEMVSNSFDCCPGIVLLLIRFNLLSEFKKLCLNTVETVRSLRLNRVSSEDILAMEMKDEFKLEYVTMDSVLYSDKFEDDDPYLDKCTSNSNKATGDQPSSKRQKHHCNFCKTYVGNFARHVLRHHMSEPEVAEIADQPARSRKRKQMLSSLRNKVSTPVQPRVKKSVKRVLVSWTEHQKVAVYRHFKRNIEETLASNKIECERFKLEHQELA